MKIVKNHEAVLEALETMLMQFLCEMRNYYTDIYLYIDETGNGTLDEFQSVDGRSWSDDGHDAIIYTDKPHEETIWDWYCEYDTETLAEVIGTDAEELAKKVAEFAETEPEEIGWHEVRDYLASVPEYAEKLTEAYQETVKSDFAPDMHEKAVEILSELEDIEFE